MYLVIFFPLLLTYIQNIFFWFSLCCSFSYFLYYYCLLLKPFMRYAVSLRFNDWKWILDFKWRCNTFMISFVFSRKLNKVSVTPRKCSTPITSARSVAQYYLHYDLKSIWHFLYSGVIYSSCYTSSPRSVQIFVLPPSLMILRCIFFHLGYIRMQIRRTEVSMHT